MNAPGPHAPGGDDRPPWRRLKPVQVAFVVALFAFVLWRHPFDERASTDGPDTTGAGATLTLRGQALGTAWTVRWRPGAGEQPETPTIQAAIESALDRVDGLMSTWKPDSELMRLNRAPVGAPFAIAEQTAEVLRIAEDISRKSDGAFDVTVGPLVRAWGFGAGAPRGDAAEPAPPTAAELERIAAAVGWQKLRVATDTAAGTATATRTAPGLTIDLSAIAKGYAVDAVAAALQGLGLRDFFVEVGGEVVARGSRGGGEPWRLGIETPTVGAAPGSQPPQRVVPLTDRALATSGDYRSYREVAGRRVSHTIDPRTRRPIDHPLASVSVVADDCAHADAWATALNVLGPQAGMALAEREGLAVLMLVRNEAGGFDVLVSRAFEEVDAQAGQRGG